MREVRRVQVEQVAETELFMTVSAIRSASSH